MLLDILVIIKKQKRKINLKKESSIRYITNGQDVTFNQYIDNFLSHTGTINTDTEWLEIQLDEPESGINFQIEFSGTAAGQVLISPPLVFKYKITDIKV